MTKNSKQKEIIPVIRSLEPNPDWQPIAVLLAWVLPGAGHFILGQRTRGIVIGLTIMIMFLSGLFIGGLGIMDWRQPPEQPPVAPSTTSPRKLSFLGVWQPLSGPGLIGCLYKRGLDQKFKHHPKSLSLNYYPSKGGYAPRYGYSYEIGVLYTAIAGMLNLLAIIDVIFADPKFRRENDLVKSSGDSRDSKETKALNSKTEAA